MLAEVYGKAGQTEEGLTVLAEASEVSHTSGKRYYAMEIHRLRGESLLMQGGDKAEVERHYRQAIEVARQQSAKSWQLRAVMGLCRLWQEQGNREEAQQRLAEIHGWFTEGAED